LSPGWCVLLATGVQFGGQRFAVVLALLAFPSGTSNQVNANVVTMVAAQPIPHALNAPAGAKVCRVNAPAIDNETGLHTVVVVHGVLLLCGVAAHANILSNERATMRRT
jgi:hypothetical protein